MTDDKKLTDLVNQSGFPLQIALADLVLRTSDQHGWKVLYSEHAWKAHNGESSGFIDLVLEDRHHTSVLAIECKRVLESSWIFLKEERELAMTGAAKLWMSYTLNSERRYFGWFDAGAEPGSPESGFCVVPGQDAKSRPMLERVGADLVASTEALAHEEGPQLEAQHWNLRMYASVLITTATLKVCRLSAASISLADGRLSNASFTDAPVVRLRKQLSAGADSLADTPPASSDLLARAKEHTVFVVNALALESFLRSWTVHDASLRALM